ncbi:MAG: DUF1080 domain-containing protein [Akkermansiaceae bacterium]|nr:DUF1080 domain-containing protein [Akkermansiaceae bacterium]
MKHLLLPACAGLLATTLHAAEPNTLSAEEKAAGFKLIFDGKSLDGFRNYKQEEPNPKWQVKDGAIVLTEKGGGDLITKEQYADFEFRFEFQIAQDGNSGIMWHVTEQGNHPFESGPEYQILDSFAKTGYPHEIVAKNLAGGFYGIIPVEPEVSKPAGEWNSGSIRVEGTKITLTINGHVTAKVDTTTEDWKKKLAASKFADWPNFNKAGKGHFALQDHGDKVAFRSLRMKAL